MNNEFTRMQKLAGILTEGYNTHSEGMHGYSKEDATEGSRKGKMRVSEFKKKLKEAILAEKALKEDVGEMGLTGISYEGMKRMDSLVSRNDTQAFLFSADRIMTTLREDGFDDEDIINYLIELLPTPYTLSEAKKKKGDDKTSEEGDINIDLDSDVENDDLDLGGVESEINTNVDMNMDNVGDIDAGSSESKKAFGELTDAYRAAKELGDEKLIRQIANTITYFNKNIILKQG